MQISERLEGPILVLAVEGRLDNNASDLFREKAMAHIRDGVLAVVVDFSQTTYVASMGIRALFIPAQELSRRKGSLVLAGLCKDIKHLFITAGILDLFEVFDDADGALGYQRRWLAKA